LNSKFQLNSNSKASESVSTSIGVVLMGVSENGVDFGLEIEFTSHLIKKFEKKSVNRPTQLLKN